MMRAGGAVMAWLCTSCAADNPDGTRFCGYCGAPALSGDDARAPDATDERRLVTALFADVSGFTALADRIDADELHEIIQPVIARLAAVAERYEGFVANYAGDALLVFFGAPVAYEDHAARALLVAAEMHRELARALPSLSPSARALRLHVGVESGRVISGLFGGETNARYSILGDAVNTAQRLCSVAPAGETYLGESVQRLASERFELEYVGELTLKGKQNAVPAWRLAGERGGGGGTIRRRGALIGREPELEAWARVLDATAEGDGRTVSVTGEAGVGKSVLLAEARARAEARGFAWLQARCISYGSTLAYWPFADLLRRAFGLRGDEPVARGARMLSDGLAALGLEDEARYLARLIGVATDEDVSRMEPEAFQAGLHRAFRGWFAALAERAPVVLAVEDVHWADAPTIALLHDLAAGASHALTVVLTARTGAEDHTEKIAQERVTRIDLRPLDHAGIETLVERLLAGPPPFGFVDIVAERTTGNPFFVEEVVRALRDSGDLVRSDGRWRLAPGWDADAVPPTIEGVLSARIDLLPKDAAAVLQTASVIGRTVRLPLLRAVATDVHDLPATLEQLVRGAFLDPVEGGPEEALLFHHALAQEVAYARLVRARRREIHLKIAEAGERLYGSGDDLIDFLARNLYLGGAGAKAINYLVRAGERARTLFANEAAIQHFSRAAEVAREHARDRVPYVELDLAALYELIGEHDEAVRLYADARDATNDLRAWCGMASVLRKSGEYDRALQALDGAEAALRPRGAAAVQVALERAAVLELQGRFQDAASTARQGLGAAHGRRDANVARLLTQLASVECSQGSIDDAVRYARDADAICTELDDPLGRSAAARVIGMAEFRRGAFDEAAEAFRLGLELATRVGRVDERAGCLVNLGYTELQRGNLPEAISCDRQAIELFEAIGRNRPGLATAYSNLAEKLMHAGHHEEALLHATEGHRLATELGLLPIKADSLQTLSQIHVRLGNLRLAADLAVEGAELWAEVGDLERSRDCYLLAAEASGSDGDAERARELDSRARSLA